jgi:hypothetical protein
MVWWISLLLLLLLLPWLRGVSYGCMVAAMDA